MHEMVQRVNPLKSDALTADAVYVGVDIICWQPKKLGTTRHLRIVNGPYHDDDGTMVVDVRDKSGKEWTEETDTVGLTGNRYTGEWSTIAIPDDEFDD